MSDIRIKLALDGAGAVVKDIEHVKAQFGGMHKALAGLGGALSVAAFTAFIRGSINAADEMSKLSAKTGVAVKDVAGLQLAYRQSGLSAEVLQSSLSKLNRGMVDGNKAFDAMGLSARNADGTLKTTRQMLGEVADKFNGYQDGAAKSALAMEIFGKSGAEMLPLLNGGSQALDEFDAMAQKLGLTLDAETAKQAEKFNDTLDLMGQGAQGVGRQIAAQLLPTLSGLAGQFFESMTSGDRLTKVTGFLSTALRGLYVVGVGVIEIFSTVGKTLGGVSAAVVAALSGDFRGAANILRDMKNDIGAGWETTLADMTAAWNTTGNASVEAMASTMGAAQRAAPEVAKLGKAAKEVKDEFADLLNKLTAKDAGLDPSFYKDLDTLYKGWQQGRIGVDAYRQAVEKLIGNQQFAKDIAKENAQAIANEAAAQNKAFDEYEAAEAKRLQATEDRIKAGRTMLESLQHEIRLQGMSTRERQVATAMLELERQGVVKGTEAYEAYATQIREAIEIKAANDEHIKMWESIDQTAHDVFVNIFEDGAGTFKRLGQTLKAALLDWLYQMTVKKWIINIQGQFSGGGGAGGTAAQVASGGGGAGAGGALSSLGSMFGAGGLTGALGAGAGWLTGAASFGQIMGAAGSLIQTGTMAGVMSGAAMGLGAVMPVIGGLMAVVSIAKKFKSPGEQHTGGFYSSSGAAGMDAALGITDGNEAWARDLVKRANPEIESMVGTVVGSVIESTTAQAKALGMDIAVGIDAGFAANTNGKGKNKNAFGYFDVTINGETVAEYVNRTLGEDVTNATAQWTSDMTDAVAEWVLGGKDVIKAGETAGQALARLSTNLTSVNSTFDVLGYRMFDASVDGAALASSLVDAFGSLERFGTLAGQFYQSYYSDSERFATSQRLLREQFAALNVDMPRSTASFRALVESAQAAGDSGLMAALLELGPAFHAAASAVEAAFDNISRTTATSVRDIQMSLLDNRGKYELLNKDILGLINKLSTATLPAEIEALFNQINSATMQAWGLLDADEQKRLGGSFIDRLYDAEALAQERLNASLQPELDAAAQQAQVSAQQMAAADRQVQAAEAQAQASADMVQAARDILAAAREVRAAAAPAAAAPAPAPRTWGTEVAFA